jgi:hypothetical protein
MLGHKPIELLSFYKELLQTGLKLYHEPCFAFQIHYSFKRNVFTAQKSMPFTSRPSLKPFLVKNISLGILEHVVYSLFSFVSLKLIHANFSNDSKRLRISLVIRQHCSTEVKYSLPIGMAHKLSICVILSKAYVRKAL